MKIFHIDDDPVQHFLIKKIITKYDSETEIQFFFDAELALVQLDANHQHAFNLPDVILLDIQMPRLNGWDFLNQFNQISTKMVKAVKIYILTSAIGKDELAKAKSYPAVHHFFYKPLNLQSLDIIYNPSQIAGI